LRGKSPTISGRVSIERLSIPELKLDLADAIMTEVSYPEIEASLVSDLSSRVVAVASKASQETRRWREETRLILEL
jgi:hypothetical protein